MSPPGFVNDIDVDTTSGIRDGGWSRRCYDIDVTVSIPRHLLKRGRYLYTVSVGASVSINVGTTSGGGTWRPEVMSSKMAAISDVIQDGGRK